MTAVFILLWLILIWMVLIWNGLTLQMVVSQSVIMIGIMIARVLLRGRVRASVLHGLWFLLVLRLLVGIFFSMFLTETWMDHSWSVNRFVNTVVSSVADIEERDGDEWKDMDTEPVRFDLTTVKLNMWVKGIWFAGAIVFCLFFSFFNERLRRQLYDRRVRMQVPDCPYPVYMVPETSNMESKTLWSVVPSADPVLPCVVRIRGENGIYLSEEAAENDNSRKYVLAHEISHLKHHDLFWAGVRNFMLAFFWFHPLMWVSAVLAKRDNEMACDERAIERLGDCERKRYGEVLIDLVDISNRKDDIFYLATTMTAGKKELKQRIHAIVSGRHSKEVAALVACLLTALLVVIGFTTYMKSAPSTAEQVIQHFYYYEAKGNEHGMLKLYPEKIRDDYFFSYGRRGKVVDIEKITEMKGQENKIFDYVPPHTSQYPEIRTYQAEIVREIPQKDGSNPVQIERSTDYFLVVREKADMSWQIEDFVWEE